MVGSSSRRRCIAVLILSSSLRVLGSMAYASTGSGNVMLANDTVAALSHNTSFVCVSFSFATAPMSPAFSSGTCVCVLPCSTSRWPSRSGASRVRLWTVVSDSSEPETTLSIVIRPANGSAIVFHTRAM